VQYAVPVLFDEPMTNGHLVEEFDRLALSRSRPEDEAALARAVGDSAGYLSPKGTYPYKCTVPGHAATGMRGVFTIT
jgi:hypothetical protein